MKFFTHSYTGELYGNLPMLFNIEDASSINSALNDVYDCDDCDILSESVEVNDDIDHREIENETITLKYGDDGEYAPFNPAKFRIIRNVWNDVESVVFVEFI